ncbi:MAG: S-layer homology domain-containing protein, partial [Defluviitaleaceae bacterium]|nr:S-layer homology domain-containing protein [Defluviitaleaceae bacterium]
NNPATIAEFLRMTIHLARANTYADVQGTHWARNYIWFAYDNRLFENVLPAVTSFDDAAILSDEPITREFAFYVMYQVFSNHARTSNRLESSPRGEVLNFNDADDISDAFRDAVNALSQVGVVTGRPNLTLAPNDSITRAEVTAILFRMVTPVGSVATFRYLPVDFLSNMEILDYYGTTVAPGALYSGDGRFNNFDAMQRRFYAPETGVFIFSTSGDDFEYGYSLFRIIDDAGAGHSNFERVFPVRIGDNVFLLEQYASLVVETTGAFTQDFAVTVMQVGYDGYEFILPYYQRWLVFSHYATDTELFITETPMSAFGPYNDAYVGITRFLGNRMGDVYVLRYDGWRFIGQIEINRDASPQAQAVVEPYMLGLPVVSFQGFGGLSVTENPFVYTEFAEFAWGRLRAYLNSITASTLQVQNVTSLAESMISLKAISRVTPELISDVISYHEEWDEIADLFYFGDWNGDSFDALPYGDLQIAPMFVVQIEPVMRAFTLSRHDGMSHADFATTTMIGNTAEGIATHMRYVFPDCWEYEVVLRKSYRHFIWNYWTTLYLDENAARIATTNREWGGVLSDRRTARYNYYRNQGFNRNDANVRADAYMIELRYWLMAAIYLSPGWFYSHLLVRNNNFFYVWEVVDFWNNEAGRRYALSSTANTNQIATGDVVFDRLRRDYLVAHTKQLFDNALENGSILYCASDFRSPGNNEIPRSWTEVRVNNWWISVR